MHLAEIFARHPDTDKDGPNGLHSYGPFYEELFAGRPVRSLLEVGVRRGGSLLSWRDYFPTAQIYGVDNGSEVGFWQPTADRIRVFQGDTTRPQSLGALKFWAPFDVVIDDGLHRPLAQAITFGILRPLVSPGGVYVIEDVEDYDQGRKLAELIGGRLIDLRYVRNRHDDVLIVVDC